MVRQGHIPDKDTGDKQAIPVAVLNSLDDFTIGVDKG